MDRSTATICGGSYGTDARPHHNKQTGRAIIAAIGIWWSLLAILYSTNFVQQFVSRLNYWPNPDVIAIMPLGFFAGLYSGLHLIAYRLSFLKTVVLPILANWAMLLALYVFLSDRAGHWILWLEFWNPDTGAVNVDYLAIIVGYTIASAVGAAVTLVKDGLGRRADD